MAEQPDAPAAQQAEEKTQILLLATALMLDAASFREPLLETGRPGMGVRSVELGEFLHRLRHDPALRNSYIGEAVRQAGVQIDGFDEPEAGAGAGPGPAAAEGKEAPQ